MAYARQCDRCRRVVAPRGNLPARFCPYCGAQLSGAPVVPPRSPSTSDNPSTAPAAAGIICGILGLVLPCVGIFPAVLAIGFGAEASRRSVRLPGQPGNGAARAGVILGIIGLVFQVMICARLA